MDYLTQPTSRKELRAMAPFFRELFGLEEASCVPVLSILERLPDVFRGCCYEVVEDNALPPDTPARCKVIDEDSFQIQIKESVYDGAYRRGTGVYRKGIGAYRGFILHEIVHVFLYKIGFKPVFTRSFEKSQMPAYFSVEWQTKALTGEIMMPYEETRGMRVEDIMEEYGVSKGFALYRQSY